MSKVMQLDNAENQQLRAVLVSLMLVRAAAIKEKRFVNKAIRQRCKEIILTPDTSPMLIAMAEHISCKRLCDVELLKAVTTYNELVRGELEMIRDGELVIIDSGSQTEIK